MSKTAQNATPISFQMVYSSVLISQSMIKTFSVLHYLFVFMAANPPSCRRGYQFRAEELNDFLDLVENFLPISMQNWQAVADIHLEKYRREAQTAKSLHQKFQEICRRTSPMGDPNCSDYVIRAKRINRQLVQMVDALSGELEADRNDDGLSNSNGSDTSDETGVAAGDFSNVTNDFSNAAAIEEDIHEEEDAGDAGFGADDVAPVPVVGGDKGVPAAEGNVVADAFAIPRGPGRSCVPPTSAAGVAEARGGVDGQNAASRSGSAADHAKVDRCSSRSSGMVSSSRSSGTANDLGHGFCTPINRGRKRCTGDVNDNNDGSLSSSNIIGIMMMQQRSEQNSRDADHMARETEVALWQEKMTLHRNEMTLQLQIQREESCAHQQMINIMLMAMMQNIGGTNQQQRTNIGWTNQQLSTDTAMAMMQDIGGTTEQQRTDIGGTNQQLRIDSAMAMIQNIGRTTEQQMMDIGGMNQQLRTDTANNENGDK